MNLKTFMSALAVSMTMVGVPSVSAGDNVYSLDQISARPCGALKNKLTTSIDTMAGARFSRSHYLPVAEQKDPEFPWMAKLNVVLQDLGGGNVMVEHCGATLINSRWLLTAAHCVSDDFKRIEIRLGAKDFEAARPIVRVATDVVCHSQFFYTGLYNDIALIHLEEPAPRELPHVVLPAQTSKRPPAGAMYRAAGWQVSGDIAEPSTSLRKPDVTVRDNQGGPQFITVTDAYGGTQGVCQGESGGPLVDVSQRTPMQVGVLSGTDQSQCLTSNYEMYFTPVAQYSNWVQNVINFCDMNPDACENRGTNLAEASPLRAR